MGLPKKHLKSAKGQILILFLLVLVVGVAIVLSVASRTITDIRTTTTSDESNRAYFAAEAGIEEALQELQGGGALSSPLTISFPEVNTSAVTSDVTPSGGGTIFVYPQEVQKDDVIQLSMLEDFDNLGSNGWQGGSLTFYWGASPYDNVNKDLNPAIEISAVYLDGSDFKITKFAFDPFGGRGNNFCTNVTQHSPIKKTDNTLVSTGGISKDFYFSATIDNIRASDPVLACPDDKHGSGITGKLVLLRIRALYNQVPMPIAVETSPTEPLFGQGTVIESTGTTSSGVTRKLQVIRLYPALPALFDYVLFSGSDLAK